MKATVLLRALDGSLGSERCSPGGPVAAGTPCRPFPSLVTAGSSLWLRQADSARGVSGGANRHPPLFLTRSVLVCRGRSGLDVALGTFCVIDAPDGVTRRCPRLHQKRPRLTKFPTPKDGRPAPGGRAGSGTWVCPSPRPRHEPRVVAASARGPSSPNPAARGVCATCSQATRTSRTPRCRLHPARV